MKREATVLIYGRDPVLLETRRLILARSGLKPVTVLDLPQAHRIIKSLNVDLLILCSSVSDEESVLVLEELRRLGKSKTKTLVLRKDGTRLASQPTETLASPVDPRTFQSVVGTLVQAEPTGD